METARAEIHRPACQPDLEPCLTISSSTLPVPAAEFAAGDQALASLRPLWNRLGCTRGFDIRLAHSAEQQRAVNALVQRRYAWRGYNTEALAPRGDMSNPATPANRLTIGAWRYNELAATLTVSLDGGQGLQNDALYTTELARLRRPDRVLGEVSRLAVDPDFSCPELLMALFRSTLRSARDLGASDLVIGVNPRHAGYYQRQFGFRKIGRRKQCGRLAAPVVLLHCALDDLALLAAGPTVALTSV